MLQAIGATAVIIVPLMSAVGTIGAITLVTSESMRRLSDTDIALAERLGPFGHMFKSLPLLDTIPKAEQLLYLSDFTPTLAACAATTG